MGNLSLRVEQIVSAMKKAGHRVTPQRLAILREFADSHAHPSVESVYTAVQPSFPTTSLATVYKTIALLKELGEVVELSFGEGRNHYDVRMVKPHPHLICMGCRRIVDANLPSFAHLADRLAETTGFQMLSHRVDFYGLCPECRNVAPQ